MNAIRFEATPSTPMVRLNRDNYLEIKGRSISEGSAEFYQPLIDWAYEFKTEKILVDINLEYVNSSSLKKLLYFLKILDVNMWIETLRVNWHYEEGDEDSLEKGRVLKSFLRKAQFSYQGHKEEM